MLRISWDQESSPARLRLHGKVSGPWVEELKRVWGEMAAKSPQVIVDLTEVTFVGRDGRQLLGEMLRQGTELQGGPMMKFTIDRIRQESQNSHGSAKGGE